MARSRVGGTSAKLSGVLGSLVFSIGQSPDGGYEQYIASYNGDRENPNTKYQALARMQIALIERMVHLLSPVLKASFENVAVGVQSVNEFSRLNVASVQDYCKNYWKYAFGWSFPTKGNPLECWAPLLISYGSFPTPKAWSVQVGGWPRYVRTFRIQLAKQVNKVVDIRKALGITRNGSFNIIEVFGIYEFARTGALMVKGTLNPVAGDSVLLTPENISSIVQTETRIYELANTEQLDVQVLISYDSDEHVISIRVTPRSLTQSGWTPFDTFLAATIFSDYKKNRWVKSTARLEPPQVYSYDDEYGRPPYEAFQTWDENYHDEEYDEYFGKK